MRPCSCKDFEEYFVAKEGVDGYNGMFTRVQQQCAKWCETGNKPHGVIDSDTFFNKVIPNLKLFSNKYILQRFLKTGKLMTKQWKLIRKTIRIGVDKGKRMAQIFRKIFARFTGNGFLEKISESAGIERLKDVIRKAREKYGNIKRYKGKIGEKIKKLSRGARRRLRRYRRNFSNFARKITTGIARGFSGFTRTVSGISRKARNGAKKFGRGVKNIAGRFGRGVGRRFGRGARRIGRGARRIGRGVRNFGRSVSRRFAGFRAAPRRAFNFFRAAPRRTFNFFRAAPRRVFNVFRAAPTKAVDAVKSAPKKAFRSAKRFFGRF
jgi:hypothetical protein